MKFVHTDAEGVLVRGHRFVLDRVQGPETIWGDELVAVLQVGRDPHVLAGLLWTIVDGGRAQIGSGASLEPLRYLWAGSVVEVHGGFDKLDMVFDVGGDGIVVASLET